MLIETLRVLFVTGAYPLWQAWQGNRHTSLRHAVGWAIAAWIGWGLVVVLAMLGASMKELDTPRYLALCLTSCAAVAVLGARRPGVAAWNFVVLGLLSVMLLPLAERLVAGPQPPGVVRGVFLCATLAVGVLNYLPTRLAPAAVLFAAGCAGELVRVLDPAGLGQREAEYSVYCWLSLALVPGAAYLCWRRRPAVSAFDRLWLDFRDRFGLLWSQRLREQFNRAAANAGWPAHLSWAGLAGGDDAPAEAPLETLRAMLKRFMPSGDQGALHDADSRPI